MLKITNRQRPGLILAVAMMVVPTGAATAGAEQKGISLDAGFRRDSLDWNIADYDNSPNVLSELTWRDLNIFQVKGEMAGANVEHIYFRATFDYGWVLSGENQDSDYDGDNRTLEFSRSINGVDGSSVWDLSLGFGQEFSFGNKGQHRFIPQAGLSYNSQNLRMSNGHQVIPGPGPIPGLRSSYDATWAGLWLGADTLLDLRESGNLRLRLEYHWKAWYSANANWNLRDEFAHPVSFEHEAVGEGLLLGLAWRGAPIRKRWVLGADLTYQIWTTDSGTDRVYWSDCYCYSETPLNEVNWSSLALSVSLRREM